MSCVAIPSSAVSRLRLLANLPQNAPGGFYYLNVSNPPLSREDLQLTVSLSQGKPISTTFESLAHRQAAPRSSAFFPVSRQTVERW